MIIKLVQSNDVPNLKLLFQLANSTSSLSSPVSSSSSSTTTRCLSKLLEIKDGKQRNLVHIACKYGHKQMLQYLIHDLGLSVTNVDQAGNNSAHLVLVHALKSLKPSHKKKRRRIKNCPVRNYIDCCELLKIILHKHSNLLMISNKRGQKVTDLLQVLWNHSSECEREIGDNILQSVLSTTNNNSDEHSPTYQSPSSATKPDYYERTNSFLSDSDEANYSSNEWEDYFSGFSDRSYKSHLDSIRDEYEYRNRTIGFSKKTKLKQPTNKLKTEQSHHFSSINELSNEKLFNHKLNNNFIINNSYKVYLKKWKEFINSDQTIILNYNDILWPPFIKVNEMNLLESTIIDNILRFVEYSTKSLRQLQVDWHPDKFAGRFGKRFKSEHVKNRVMKRVLYISQLLNKATDYLRDEKKKR
ncbi:unnamed protein product [Heterobilharzia americana]|nr:unnamed protein product [Heterobilharzia americana]